MRRRFFSSQSKVSFSLDNYLTIEALEDGLTVAFSQEIEYGIDGIGWDKLGAGYPTPPIKAGQTISFKGTLTPIDLGIGTFRISMRCNLKGNCMSLLFGDNATDNLSLEGKMYAFYELFKGCSNIVSISSIFLPATTLSSYCYYGMFRGCTSLTIAPELPSTTLAEGCYGSMFYGCSSLTTAPALPATTLVYQCYYDMFSYCSKLNYIKMLATNISATSCLSGWVVSVASTGTFVKNPNMTSLPTGIHGIPSGWTVINDGEENGSDLTFPINLEAGENGQVGIDLYHYLYDNTGDDNATYIFKDDEIVYVTGYKVTGAYYTGEFFYFGNHIDSSEYYLSLNLYSDGRLLVLID